MSRKITRRSFIKGAVAAGAVGPLILPSLSLAAPANSRLQHAAIGVGGQGASDLGQINSSGKVDVVALCDIDENNLKAAAERYPKARLYRDWREMLDKEERNIDSVNVATPDHTHAPASMTAIRKGKHVYTEKPLTHEVYETRKLTEAARKYDVATQ
ncbi:MAG: Gfo/Idh/MocA family oxidoreductase, partial [Candidatus Hydrogenedentota bacterium]